MRRERLVIVGAGPAGVAAAVQAARLGVRPALIDREGVCGGLVRNAWRMENYPGLAEPIPGPAFASLLARHLRNFGLAVEPGEVRAVRRAGADFVLALGAGELIAEAVVLAVGTSPKRLNVPGMVDLGGRLCYEVREALLLQPKRAIVVGGGEAGVDYALSLADAGAAVDLLLRGERLRARGRLLEAAQNRAEIRFRRRCELRGFRRDASGMEAEIVENGQPGVLRADAVVVAVGRLSAAAELLPDLAYSPGDSLATKWTGLFVVGDARADFLGQAAIAVGDGLRAAQLVVDFLERRDAS
ncbi:MAG: NAD(P)/FAD-dependent oxidoreductase [Myxococcales bacterium]|nr:MAG: NAD(P)/FAD-dependent oxidoreductase [Myxococcales bacterium]